MPTPREIRRRITSIKNTQKITRAMKMVAAVKFKRAQQQILSARPYAHKLIEIIRNVEANVSERRNPLLIPHEVSNTGLMVVSSDKGLCGGFNANVFKLAKKFLADNPQKKVKLIIVGRKAREFFKRHNLPVIEEFVGVFFKVGYIEAEKVGGRALELYAECKIDELYVAYNEFKSVGLQKPVIERLLPLPSAEIEPSGIKADYIFEPGADEVLNLLLPRYFLYQIYRVFLESQAAEFAARMTAMDAATKNAGEIVDALTLNYNKVRQAGITRELLEIVGGAEALR